jgi:transaldolase/glucose-6-phosphate isomerase
MHIDAGPLGAALEATVAVSEALIERIWDRDHTVWQDDPTEVADRLGWLDCPDSMRDRADEFRRLAADVRADGIEHVLLVGMGGSSLYPEVLATVFPVTPDGLSLTVLDTTHPDAVARARRAFDLSRTLLVAASKSGSTIETRSHLERFWADLVDEVGADRAGDHVVAITDPGSSLATLGRERGFRAVVENPPDIGGRFSALSAFGLVPAALLGLDVEAHLDAARSMAEACRSIDGEDNPGVRLAALLADAATERRYQLTLLLPEEVAPFGAWVEQLVAESTGKHGLGLLPVVDEPVLPPEAYGPHRVVVAYGDHPGLDAIAERGVPVARLDAITADDLPAEVFRWEFATALAGALLGINPFDQPDVQAAKTASVRVLEEGGAAPEPTAAGDLLAEVGEGDYVALLAFVDPGGEMAARLPGIAAALRDRQGVPVTIGVGPRYLHSTGQLHKGGPDAGVFAMLLDEPTEDVDVPGRGHTFGELLRAQAAGDLTALRDRRRRAGRVELADLEDRARRPDA